MEPVKGLSSAPPPPPLPCATSLKAGHSTSRKSTETTVSLEEQILQSLSYWTSRGMPLNGYSVYNHVDAVLQEGPMCGIVALSMASQLIAKSKKSSEELLSAAREFGVTLQGEIFSVDNMKKVAENTMPDVEVTVMRDLYANRAKLINHLQQGWPALVPYDADGNHEPALKNGHKAHWCILIGYCLLYTDSVDHEHPPPLKASPTLTHLAANESLPSEALDKLSKESTLFIVYAKQGKSKYFKALDFSHLCKSNQNLEQVDPKLDNEYYNLPENCDLTSCLCDRFLLLKPTK